MQQAGFSVITMPCSSWGAAAHCSHWGDRADGAPVIGTEDLKAGSTVACCQGCKSEQLLPVNGGEAWQVCVGVTGEEFP